MVEEQVDEEVVAAHLQVDLPSHISEPGAEFEEEVGDVIDQGCSISRSRASSSRPRKSSL